MALKTYFAGKYSALKAFLEFMTYLENGRAAFSAYRAGNPLPPLKLKNGPTIYHSEADDIVGLFREVIVLKCYTPADFYRPKAGDLVLDIGANIGVFALSLQQGKGGVRVYSFEPATDTRERLTRNVAGNNLSDTITIHPRAVSDSAGILRLKKSNDAGHRSLFSSKFVDETNSEEVETVTLAWAAARTGDGPIDLLKIDIEGAEIEAMAGADDATWKRVQRVVVEYHDLFRPGCCDRVVEVLKLQGFSQIDVLPEPSTPGLGIVRASRSAS